MNFIEGFILGNICMAIICGAITTWYITRDNTDDHELSDDEVTQIAELESKYEVF